MKKSLLTLTALISTAFSQYSGEIFKNKDYKAYEKNSVVKYFEKYPNTYFMVTFYDMNMNGKIDTYAYFPVKKSFNFSQMVPVYERIEPAFMVEVDSDEDGKVNARFLDSNKNGILNESYKIKKNERKSK